MGQRTKRMIQKSRRRGVGDGTHEDKYAAKRERDERVRVAAESKRFVSNDERVAAKQKTADAESEEVLASLPGGTIAERMESARRGLFQNQDSMQTRADARSEGSS